MRLSSTSVVSIAKVCGRTRCIGNEFMLAYDMRFASRQNALFGKPEVGDGLVPSSHRFRFQKRSQRPAPPMHRPYGSSVSTKQRRPLRLLSSWEATACTKRAI